MSGSNSPINDVGSASVKEVGKILQNIIPYLRKQPVFLFGIACMLLAIIGLVILALVPNAPTSLTLFPYALLIFGVILIVISTIARPYYLQNPGVKADTKRDVDNTLVPRAQQLEDQDSHRQVKTVKSLAGELSNLSASQRKIMKVIAEENGIYVFQLMEKLNASRDEIVYRCKDLERMGLINILQLTDYSYEIPSEDRPLYQKKTIQEILNA